ncbi:G patch domain-containing protein 4 [Apus apus]|uniref:G patch domain-containing protein 4 n=1 Tax=Apus apus TaxID=8895 RepID=UPI0021F8C595|nr:G patch domain-containing protein 4 [Apus apus]
MSPPGPPARSPPGPPTRSPPEPPGPGMRFAERQLRRHGWRSGQGLGKREDGIAEAIRVKVKCDTAGVGHDAAEPFSFHWWDHIFNKAAANVAVEAGQDGISMKTVSEEGVRVSNKKPLKASSPGTMLYGRFVKSATLTARGEEPTKLPSGSESSEEEELDLSSARRLTDEELVRACGGRTAHKGARHGLTMSAKLARLEEQERAFLATYRHEEQQHEPPESSPPAERLEKKKKRKRSRGDPEVLQNQESSREEEEVGWEEGKVMKRKKSREPSEEDVAGEEGMAAKKKKKKQEQDKEEPVETEKKKKKKKKKKEENKEELVETEVPLEDTDGPDQVGHSPRKKRKKRKREPE